MDCEGAEYDILFNTPPEIMNRVHRVCMEVHEGSVGHTHQEMQEFLKTHGYQTRLTKNAVHADLAYLYAWRSELETSH